MYTSNLYLTDFLKNEICSHVSEKASKGRFPKPEKLQNHSNEGKAKKRKKRKSEEQRKKQWLNS